MDLVTFIQQFINGVSLGGLYALVAIGYTMVYGVLRLINFAHADIMMVGAFGAYVGVTFISDSFAFGVLFAIIVAIISGVLTDKIAYKPLRNAPRISLLITAIGISFFLQNIVNVTFGGTPKYFATPEFFTTSINVSGVILTPNVIIVPIMTLMILFVLLLILYKSKYGIAIRALAFDFKTVSLMGIDSNKIIMIVFIIGSMLAAISGVFWSIAYPILTPYMGVLLGLKAFGAAVLGGIGSVTGAVLGGFILGFSEIIFVAIFPEYGGFKDAIAFVFLIFILLFRPSGIMGIDFEKNRF